MKYENLIPGRFVRRLNRFLAECEVEGEVRFCHVPNTSRLTELQIPGNPVLLLANTNPHRKTRYTLLHMQKAGKWVHIDSQAPNHILYEALRENPGLLRIPEPFQLLRKEARFLHSRLDMYYETESTKGYIEVKGVTLEQDGIACFPGAPTTRGVKHLKDLAEAVRQGYTAHLVFVTQFGAARAFRVNRGMDPAFGAAYDEAKAAGVQVHAFQSIVEPTEVILSNPIPYE